VLARARLLPRFRPATDRRAGASAPPLIAAPPPPPRTHTHRATHTRTHRVLRVLMRSHCAFLLGRMILLSGSGCVTVSSPTCASLYVGSDTLEPAGGGSRARCAACGGSGVAQRAVTRTCARGAQAVCGVQLTRCTTHLGACRCTWGRLQAAAATAGVHAARHPVSGLVSAHYHNSNGARAFSKRCVSGRCWARPDISNAPKPLPQHTRGMVSPRTPTTSRSTRAIAQGVTPRTPAPPGPTAPGPSPEATPTDVHSALQPPAAAAGPTALADKAPRAHVASRSAMVGVLLLLGGVGWYWVVAVLLVLPVGVACCTHNIQRAPDHDRWRVSHAV
jgi:hypothetical protein